MAPSGKVLCVPKKENLILLIDPTMSPEAAISEIAIGHIVSGDHKYAGAVLGLSGLIYFTPLRATGIGVLDPSTEKFSVVDIATNFVEDGHSNYFCGAVLAPNGRVYFTPATRGSVGVYDPGDDYPAYRVGGGALSDSWRVLLSPQRNKR